MTRIFRFFVRSFTFLRKEVMEVIRQPRLVLLFVLGPFLIMLLFGLGYRTEARALRTIFVASPDNPLAGEVEEYAKTMGPQLVYQGLLADEAAAMAELKNGRVDMVVVVPEDVAQKLENNEQAIFQMYHNEIDPFQASYVEYVGQFYVEELNQRVLGQLVTGSQTGIAGGAEQVNENSADVDALDGLLAEFRQIPSNLLVNPFGLVANSLSNLKYTPTGFYTPAVIILLLQHLAVTFAALSIVRENNSGAMELFRVSPISAFETLLGKYLSYMIFGGILAVLISLLVVYGLGVPMLGDWEDYAVVLAALLFAALGAGFFISLISQTDTQAVQYAMLLLLASIFFSGFFIDLRLMWVPLRVLSGILPATYGIQLLQNTMLRGGALDSLLIIGLLAIGVMAFLLSWLLLQHRMKQV